MARFFLFSSGTVIPSKAGIQKRPLTSPGQGSRQSHGYLLVCCKGSVAILWAWRPLLRPASLSGNDVALGARFHRPPPAVVQWQQKVRAREAKRPLAHVRSLRDNQAWRPFSDDRFPENAGPSRMLQSNTSGCTLRGRGGTTSAAHTLQPWEMRYAGLIRAGCRRILGRARASPAG